MSISRTKTNQIKVYGDERDKTMIEAISAGLDCSQAAAGRKAIERLFTDLYPELDWEAVEQGRVSNDDLRALAQGDLSVDDLELDEEDVHDPTDRDPAHYSATVTPEQLASEGAECSYDTLREAASDLVDGGYWGEEFEVHPSRVSDTTLRQNHKIASRVLAGMARSKTKNGVIPGEVLDDLVETYCLHHTTRMDETRGEQHIRETYGDLLRSHFWRHPHPDNDVFFVSKARYVAAAKGIIDDLHGQIHDDVPSIFTYATWEPAKGSEVSEQKWHAALGKLLKSAVTARRMALDLEAADLDPLGIETVDDARDACHHLTLLTNRMYEAYERNVSDYHRTRVENHHIPCDLDEIR
jgi:hypothetical protein